MLSNHNINTSSFRIIEPKQFQQAQEIPINLSQQIPIVSINNINNKRNNDNRYISNTGNSTYSDNINSKIQQQLRCRNLSDTDSSYIPETTSESGISDLDMSEKCNCCPYGYHIDVDFVTFIQTLGDKNLNKELKKIQRKRNEKLQKSMEYVIDEVEKIRQINEGNFNGSFNSNLPNSNTFDGGSNISQKPLIPEQLKKTINKIDQHINEDINFNPGTTCKFLLLNQPDLYKNKKIGSSNNFNSNSNNILNKHQQQSNYRYEAASTQPFRHPFYEPPRRSYSSCGEPVNNKCNNFICFKPARFISEKRRCLSNRTSPIRQTSTGSNDHPSNSYSNLNQASIQRNRLSRSSNRRSRSKSPVEHYFRREIKINLAQPPYNKSSNTNLNEEFCYNYNLDEQQYQTVTTTSTIKQPQPQTSPINRECNNLIQSRSLVTITQQPEVQEEVLLNLFSCNNSGSCSSDSSESLVEYEDDRKLKINEVYEKNVNNENIIETKRNSTINQTQIMYEKRLMELEKKIQKIPELEIKNNILQEEKQILIKQLLNMKRSQSPQLPIVKSSESTKVFRTIGCDSSDIGIKRDIGIECRANTRDVGITNNIDEPKEEQIQQMQTIITHLKEKLNDQILITQQLQCKPSTRDVAVMHVVDKVEEPILKPEVRDVAINHRTEIDDQEFIEKQKIITNTYIKEIESLRIENTRLTENLEELIRKHTKHVVTRGTHACEQPILYSVGTNTKKYNTRDVQVMFTPKSRDVSLCTDRFYHTRDVGLMCSIGNIEQQEMMNELVEMRRKYEELVQISLQKIKAYRDVATVCNLDYKEHRTVSLGCNIEIIKPTRDVSLKCNLDSELKQIRDVCIGCHMDQKPIQKDACIFVDTYEPVLIEKKVVKKDFSTYVQMEDGEKAQMARELASYKMVVPKVTRDVAISVDHRSRLMDDLLRNQSSCCETIKTFSRQVNTENRLMRDSSAGTSNTSDNLLLHKACQITDNLQIEKTNQLVHQKEIIEIERNNLIETNKELKMKLKEVEEQLINEKKRVTCSTTSQQQVTSSSSRNASCDRILTNQSSQIVTEEHKTIQNCDSKKINEELKTIGINSIGITLRNQSEPSNKTERSPSGILRATITTASKSASNSPVRTIISQTNGSTMSTSLRDDFSGLNRKLSENAQQKVTKIEMPQKTTETIKISISGKIPEKGKSWSATLSPSGNNGSPCITTSCSATNITASSKQSTVSTIKTDKVTDQQLLISKKETSPGVVSKNMHNSTSSHINSSTTTSTINTTSISIRGRSSSNSPKRSISAPAAKYQESFKETTNEKLVNESSEKITYQNGQIIEKKIIEKIELKKPKGILKSPSTNNGAGENTRQESTCESIQRKNLTFGENEICENFQSEQSGSEFSLDENSQSNCLNNIEDDEYMTTSVIYEAPIGTNDGIVKQTLVSEDKTIRSLKSGNNNYDDYELQEKLCKSEIKSFKENNEDDTNESNLQNNHTSINRTYITKSTSVSAKIKNISTEQSSNVLEAPKSFELELELHIACAILNDSLYEPLKADKNKVAKALNLIQQDWFKLAAQKDSNPTVVEDHLNAFYSRFSNLLLERIVNMADLNLNTALHYSVSTGNFEIVNLLLDTKVCDVNAQNKAGYTSIMLAAVVPMTNDFERSTLKRLFAEGNVNIKSTDSGQTALMLAVRHGNKDTVSLLLEAGSDCNAQDKEGSTALMAACEHGHIDIVRLLLDNTNCDPDIKDNDGETAFDIAKNKNRNDIIVLLYAHSSKLRSHHPAIQFSKSRPRIGSASSQKK